MQLTESQYKNQNNHNLYTATWLPPQTTPTTATIAIIHGLGEHTRRYDYLAQKFTQQGYACMGIDHQGFGRSEGPRGHLNTYTDFYKEVDHLLTTLKQNHPNVPHYLFGHSLGGQIVLNYLLEKDPQDLAGVISTGPWLREGKPIPKILQTLAKMMNSIYPKYLDSNRLPHDELSDDPKSNEAYKKDPYTYGKATARLYVECDKYSRLHWKEKTKVGPCKAPLLLVHADKDKITDPEASKEFAAKADPDWITFKLLPGKHELHNDLNKDNNINYYIEWIESKQP